MEEERVKIEGKYSDLAGTLPVEPYYYDAETFVEGWISEHYSNAFEDTEISWNIDFITPFNSRAFNELKLIEERDGYEYLHGGKNDEYHYKIKINGRTYDPWEIPIIDLVLIAQEFPSLAKVVVEEALEPNEVKILMNILKEVIKE